MYARNLIETDLGLLVFTVPRVSAVFNKLNNDKKRSTEYDNDEKENKHDKVPNFEIFDYRNAQDIDANDKNVNQITYSYDNSADFDGTGPKVWNMKSESLQEITV